MNNNDKFLDQMDAANNMAKKKGFTNVKDWAHESHRNGEISAALLAKVEQLSRLRNMCAHGNARNICVADDELTATKQIISKLKWCSFLNKMFDRNLVLVRQSYSENDPFGLNSFFSDDLQSFFDEVVWVNPEEITDLSKAEPEEFSDLSDTRKIFPGTDSNDKTDQPII